MLAKPKIAIIGAGLTGLSCAKKLSLAEYNPIIIEKSRGLGGRISTRRIKNRNFYFDHGAQYVSAKGKNFDEYLMKAMLEGNAAEWFIQPPNNQEKSKRKIVGLNGMTNLVRPLAANLNLHFNSPVKKIHPHNYGWKIETTNQIYETIFDIVITTIPAPQVIPLVSENSVLTSELNKVKFTSCLAAMIAFEDKISLNENIYSNPASEIIWCARNSSKPSQTLNKDCWILHASSHWSAKNIEDEKHHIAKNLLEIFRKKLNLRLPKVHFLAGHKWRFAFASLPLNKKFLVSDNKSLIMGGDWCLGNRAENAYDTGLSMANFILKNF